MDKLKLPSVEREVLRVMFDKEVFKSQHNKWLKYYENTSMIGDDRIITPASKMPT